MYNICELEVWDRWFSLLSFIYALPACILFPASTFLPCCYSIYTFFSPFLSFFFTEKVPKPEVSHRCSPTKCTLTCKGDIRESGVVTYRWKKDEGEWMVSDSGQNSARLKINNETTKEVKKFFCEMRNNISWNQSDPHRNPFNGMYMYSLLLNV